MRKTKIICTMGPATDSDEVLEKLMRGGMNVARFNFSHGSHEEQKERMDRIKAMREKCGKPVAMLLDTKGPEIRTGIFEEGKVTLEPGQQFVLTGREIRGNASMASITYPQLYQDEKPGNRILIDDGLIELIVKEIRGEDIICTVVNGGVISNHKGVNVPGVHIHLPYMSEKDKEDILFGIRQDIDFVAASFTRTAEDVMQIRKLLDENGGKDINIIAKIENAEGVDKMIIRKVYEAGKQVITATQMLDSMMKNPRPTRAETADVANAIYDGTSAIMLSGETAAGKYPVEALKTMVRIAERTEADVDYCKRFFNHERKANPDITDAICHATCTTAHDLNARVIITVTKSGRSARMISRYRPGCDIVGCAMSKKVTRQLNMSWGVTPILLEEKQEVFELFDYATEECLKQGFLCKGDVAVYTSGVPVGISGTTNMIKVQRA